MRVRNDSCEIPSVLTDYVKSCYNPEYTSDSRDVRPFGPPGDPYKYVEGAVLRRQQMRSK